MTGQGAVLDRLVGRTGRALGVDPRLVVDEPKALDEGWALLIDEVEALDLACSRFRTRSRTRRRGRVGLPDPLGDHGAVRVGEGRAGCGARLPEACVAPDLVGGTGQKWVRAVGCAARPRGASVRNARMSEPLIGLANR